jgi:hypothetical protein
MAAVAGRTLAGMNADSERPVWKVLLLDIRWGNLVNLRMWWAAGWATVFAGTAVSFLLGYGLGLSSDTIEAILGPVFGTMFVLFLLATCLIPARCADCGARVRVGATMCRAGHPIGLQR